MGVFDWLAARRGYVKPQPQLKKRKFTAAQISRLTSSWTATPRSIDAEIKGDARVMAARVRDLAKNNDHVRRFLSLVKSNVVGPQGIRMRANVTDDDGTVDELANKALETSWQDWGRVGSPDVTGKLAWRDIVRLYVESVVRDGEAILIKDYNFDGNRYRYGLQFIDPLQLDVTLNKKTANGNQIVLGVELSPRRRPVAYWFLQDRHNPDEGSILEGRNHTRVPAEFVIHSFLPEYVHQTRGFSMLTSAMMRLNMLEGYEEATLVSARLGAATTGFLTRNEQGEGYTGDDEDSDGELFVEADPGQFFQLPPGVGLDTFDPKQPSAEFADFNKAVLRGIASGLGVSYHALANDLEGVNYSSARVGVLEDRECWRALQQWTIDTLCRPVYEDWLQNAVLGQQVTVNGRPLRDQRMDAYRAVAWQPRGWAWVDPVKEMQSAQIAVSLRLRSRSDIIRDTGQDPEDVWQEIARENKRLADLDIAPMSADDAGDAVEEEDETDQE